MSSVNLHTREITIKVVYYGPGLGGKTTSLQAIHRNLPVDQRGQLVSLATRIDRTLYFDFLPVNLPKVKDYTIRLSLYTVPGQVHYNATRKLVLSGCDGVVFVADSQAAREDANIESLQNLHDNLRGHGMNPEHVPLVLQYNKRDLAGVLPVEQMEAGLNKRKLPSFETCAISGQGVPRALKKIIRLVLADLKNKGIYKDRKSEKITAFEKAPVVSPGVEEGLVQTLEAKLGNNSPQEALASEPLYSRGVTFSDLWLPGASRDQVLALEGDIERGKVQVALKRVEGLLSEQVGEPKNSASSATAEALLMLGINGDYYARYRRILGNAKPSKEDALFCLFFLTDIELRMQSAGLRRPQEQADNGR